MPSPYMNNPKNKESVRVRERRMLPFFIEFVKFSVGFAVIVAAALLTLHIATATIN